jgi:hypothetical protein
MCMSSAFVFMVSSLSFSTLQTHLLDILGQSTMLGMGMFIGMMEGTRVRRDTIRRGIQPMMNRTPMSRTPMSRALQVASKLALIDQEVKTAEVGVTRHLGRSQV